MINSALQSENFELNLRERFLLERELEIQPPYRRSSASSDNNQKLLEGLFVKRVLSDPYFSIYICNEINRSGFNLMDVFAYVNYVVMEKYLTDRSLLNNKAVGEPKLKIESLLKPQNLGYNSLRSNIYDYCRKNNLIESMEGLLFLKECMESRWRDESLFSWDAVLFLPNHALTNNSNEIFFKKLQMSESNRAIKSLEELTDFRDERRFIFENVESFMRVYNGAEHKSLSAPLFALLNFNTDFISKIKSLLEEYGLHKSLDNNEIAQYLKFYIDAVFICQFHWFSSLDQSRQLSLLNSYYDDQEITVRTENINMFSGSKVLVYFAISCVHDLYNQKRYDEVVTILSSIGRSTNDTLSKYLCASWIGDIRRERRDYSEALNYFQKAYELSIHSDMIVDKELLFLYQLSLFDRYYRNAKTAYFSYIELFDLAEMYHASGDKEKADELLCQLKDEVGKHSILKQTDIWFEIYFFSHQRQQKAAYAILKNIISLVNSYDGKSSIHLEPDLRSVFENRVKIFEDNILTLEEFTAECVESKRKLAQELLEKIGPVDYELNIDTFVLSEQFDYSSHEDNDKLVRKILESASMGKVLYHVPEIILTTVTPNKHLKRVEKAIEEMEKLGPADCNIDPEISVFDIIQRLKLEQAGCYYCLKQYDSAQSVLKKILSSSKECGVLFNSYSLLGLILAKKGKIQESIIQFEYAIDTGFPYNDYILEWCRDELLLSLDRKTLLRILDSIVDKINLAQNEPSCKYNGFLNAANTFNQFGLTDEALHFIERGLLIEDELVRLKLLEEKAYIKYLDGDMDATKSILEDIADEVVRLKIRPAIKPEYDYLLSSVNHKLAILSAKSLEFDKAVEWMDYAIKYIKEIKPDKVEAYKSLRDVYYTLSINSINYNKIDDPVVRTIFMTGEMFLIQALEKGSRKDVDYGIAFVEYGKGIETALYNTIILSLRRHIFSQCKTRSPIDNKYFKGTDELENEGIVDVSPQRLSNALSVEEGKTISLGNWKIFINEEVFSSKLFKNPYLADSYEFLRQYMPEDKWNTITENSAVIANNVRNGATHYGIKSFDYILDKRACTIRMINEIINILYEKDAK